MKIIFLLLFFLCFTQILEAQKLFGKISDNDGNYLAFALVYLVESSTGTTTNIEGNYELTLPKGNYEIIFQYIGYETTIKKINLDKDSLELNIVLNSLATNMQEIVVIAGEDPAYRIIRKAIKKRNYYDKQVKKYSCNSYIKGSQSIANLPKKIMGMSVDILNSGLDSTGTGIIYLSESISKLYYQKGEYKEVMTSSKISGNDNGFSFNSAVTLAELSFYKNTIELGESKILSPIANGALAHYRYRLVNSFTDKNNHTVHKIAVLPKNENTATFQGFIYIVEEDWAIYGTDLFTTGSAINISILDTVRFKQTHIYLGDKIWRVFSQDITFSLELLMIKTKGNFIGVFSDYEINPTFEKRFFNAEIFKVEDSANKKINEYWDSIRPIPLLQTETANYHTQDSLQKIFRSKSYLDSTDIARNKPTIMSPIMGYTYVNSYQGFEFNIEPPLDYFMFNTIQGQAIGLGLNFRQNLEKKETKWFKIHVESDYGIDDKQLRGNGYFEIKLNSIFNNTLKIEGGRKLVQFNNTSPISPLVDNFYCLLLTRNYAKRYDQYYTKLSYSQDIFNIFKLEMNLFYGERQSLINHSDEAWLFKDKNYFSNQPLDFNDPPLDNISSFATHQHLEFSLALRIRFGQKYASYPDYRYYTPSGFPDIWIRYRKGIALLGGDTDFDYLEVQITKKNIAIGTIGSFSFNALAGWFPSASKLFFMDYRHFDGNQTMITGRNDYLHTFQLLPYYEYSTKTMFSALHLEHNFNGFIWNRLPLIHKLGFEWVTGYHLLYTPEQKPYMEFNIGLNRIGWKQLRFLRVDFVMGYRPNEALRLGAVLSLNFSL